MQTQNYKFKSELRKQIAVIDFFLSKNGIEISYDMPGKEEVLLANPEQSAAILKDLEMIADYNVRNGVVEVRFLYGEPEKSITMDWTDYAIDTNISQWEAIEIVAHVEAQKQDSSLRDELSAVELVQSLLNMGRA